MAVLCTFREPSLCRHAHRELMRNAVLDLTPIIPTTACHQRNYVERYSRFRAGNLMLGFQGGVSIPLVKGGVKAPPAKRLCRAGPKAGARRGFTG